LEKVICKQSAEIGLSAVSLLLADAGNPTPQKALYRSLERHKNHIAMQIIYKWGWQAHHNLKPSNTVE
jgi:hypothetical protein